MTIIPVSADVTDLDRDDIVAIREGHLSECVYYEGGDFDCSCGFDEAADRVDEWLERTEPR